MSEEYNFSTIQRCIALLATSAGCKVSMITIEDLPDKFTKSSPVGLAVYGYEDYFVVHMDGIVEFVPSGDRTEDTDDWIIYLAKLIRNLRTKKKERITL
mgnify:FL=1|tara:strand:+ start:1632 stop:1928 length:297 start_codon:yes stop_codon:yes gene_type:complete